MTPAGLREGIDTYQQNMSVVFPSFYKLKVTKTKRIHPNKMNPNDYSKRKKTKGKNNRFKNS